MSSWLHYPTYSKDPAMPANYLGIALASCLSKLLELCNLMLFQMCSALPTCILGSRGASLLIFVLDYWRLVQSKVRFALLDMSKAFDLYGLLFELLLKQNLPCPVICFLLQWYSSQSLHCFSHFVWFFYVAALWKSACPELHLLQVAFCVEFGIFPIVVMEHWLTRQHHCRAFRILFISSMEHYCKLLAKLSPLVLVQHVFLSVAYILGVF